MIRIGIIGYSEGNGHPFSFSAIINGFDSANFSKANWPVIHQYLSKRNIDEFGFEDVRVTHAWTQFPDITKNLCDACNIDHPCSSPSEMIGKVDAVIVARDDWESHASLAMPFLQSGIPVFIDKPLTLNSEELKIFYPYLIAGMLMSCSGLRYAKELDGVRDGSVKIGAIKMINAAVLNGLEKYGIHMLEAVAGLNSAWGLPCEVERLRSDWDSFSLTLSGGQLFILNCLGSVGKTFHLSLFGDQGHYHVDLHDNFSAFRRTIGHFISMVRTNVPPIPPDEVLHRMQLIRTLVNIRPGKVVKLN